ncbi:MAG: DUF1361 domain-containing protein [Bacilli bacterium]|nr:DUF1361 domain-containing protein [Bacilli bacterium]
MKRLIFLLLGIVIGYALFSASVFLVVGDGLHIMLAWNLFLAVVPCFVGFSLVKLRQDHPNAVIPVFLVWMLFLPNSFYIVTDFIYIDQSSFFIPGAMYQPGEYLADFASYLAFFHILLGALLGVFCFIVSLSYVKRCCLDLWFKRHVWLAIAVICGLSGLAIYIGRFHRFNSWDIFNFVRIIEALVAEISWFTAFFVLSFGFIQFFVYWIYAFVEKSIINDKKSEFSD